MEIEIELEIKTEKQERRKGKKERLREDRDLTYFEERFICIGIFSDALNCYCCGDNPPETENATTGATLVTAAGDVS